MAYNMLNKDSDSDVTYIVYVNISLSCYVDIIIVREICYL